MDSRLNIDVIPNENGGWGESIQPYTFISHCLGYLLLGIVGLTLSYFLWLGWQYWAMSLSLKGVDNPR